jgi:hypothetical protein
MRALCCLSQRFSRKDLCARTPPGVKQRPLRQDHRARQVGPSRGLQPPERRMVQRRRRPITGTRARAKDLSGALWTPRHRAWRAARRCRPARRRILRPSRERSAGRDISPQRRGGRRAERCRGRPKRDSGNGVHKEPIAPPAEHVRRRSAPGAFSLCALRDSAVHAICGLESRKRSVQTIPATPGTVCPSGYSPPANASDSSVHVSPPRTARRWR